jgi:hypothetical protein
MLNRFAYTNGTSILHFLVGLCTVKVIEPSESFENVGRVLVPVFVHVLESRISIHKHLAIRGYF